MYPFTIRIPNRGLGGGANDELFLQPGSRIDHNTVSIGIGLQAVVGDHSTLFGKTLHVFGLLRQERLGDKHGEVDILHTGFLETFVKGLLNALPDGITIRLDYHTAAHVGLFGQIGLDHQLIIPLGIVFASFR